MSLLSFQPTPHYLPASGYRRTGPEAGSSEAASAPRGLLALLRAGLASLTARKGRQGRSRVGGVAPVGRVDIVGAGPGAADLLTVRALRCLQQADVLVYDKLVGPGIVALAAPDALAIYAGKSRGCHAKSQDEINALLLQHARQGRRVVRLKGGDPFIFGRGGEEQAFLQRHGIPVAVVPGVTAAAGCAAAAGIPLTHRGTAQAVTFLTGHAQDGEPDLPWRALAEGGQTLVIYMGVATAPVLARRLIDHGADPATPVAVVENGTLRGQVIGRGVLGDLPGVLARNAVTGPAVIIVGAVAALPDDADILLASAQRPSMHEASCEGVPS